MSTRRKRIKRKSRKGGDYGRHNLKTWRDNYKNCRRQGFNDHDCSRTMKNTEYHGAPSSFMKAPVNKHPWSQANQTLVPYMWGFENGKWGVKNPIYYKDAFGYQKGNVVTDESN